MPRWSRKVPTALGETSTLRWWTRVQFPPPPRGGRNVAVCSERDKDPRTQVGSGLVGVGDKDSRTKGGP